MSCFGRRNLPRDTLQNCHRFHYAMGYIRRMPSLPFKAVVIEPLDARRHLSVTPAKIGDVLGYLASDFSTRPEARLSRSAIRDKTYTLATDQPNKRLIRTAGDTVTIDAVANAKGGKKLAAQLQAIGASVLSSYGYSLTAAVPISVLAKVDTLSALQFADASYVSGTNAGLTEDYGVQAMNAEKGQKQYAVDGTGVRVGVMSNSYNALGTAAADVTSGDLPAAGVTVVDEGSSTASDEGRAMAQIVHDVAPAAAISFATASEGMSDFANNILTLAKPTGSGGQGAKVVVDDVFYFAEPMFQDGIIAQAINTAYTSYGTSYFSSAGNDSNHSWEGSFNGQAATVTAVTASGGTTQIGAGTYGDWNTSTTAADIYQPITLAAGENFNISYQWDSPFYSASVNAGGTASSQNSVSLYLLDSTKAFAVTSDTTSRVGGDAYQIMDYTNTGTASQTYYLIAKVRSGATPSYGKWVDYTGDATYGYDTDSGTSVGHAVATGSMATGAAYYADTPAFNTTPPVKESFSAFGGTQILFNANGTRKATGESRQQPAIVAPDGAATTFFGSVSSTDGQHRFYGTSSAAPHAAGVAALMLQAKPTLTNAQLYQTMESTAVDMRTAGFDYGSGYGLVDANAALASVAGSSISGTIFRDLNNNGVKDGSDTAVTGKTVLIDANNNGVVDSGTTTLSNTTAVAIPDSPVSASVPSRVTSSISSSITGRVTKATVTVNVSHANFSEVGLSLITPSGAHVPLLTTLNGYSSGTGTGANVTFTDSATSYIQGFYSTAVLGGTAGASYKPQSPLAQAIGESAAGTWQLEARDYRTGTTGTINSWSIALTYADPSTTTDSNGNYGFSALTPSAFYGTYRVRTGALNGYTFATPPAGGYDLTLARSSVVTGQNFTFVPTAPATVSSLVLDDGTSQRSLVRSITVLFDGVVPAANIAAGAFTLIKIGTTAALSTIVSSVTAPATGQTAVRLTFNSAGSSLLDGRYLLTIDGSKITNAAGTPVDAAGTGTAGSIRTYDFYRLFGDADGDAGVSINDFNALAASFGLSSGAAGYNGAFDADGDGGISINDFNQFAGRFGTSI